MHNNSIFKDLILTKKIASKVFKTAIIIVKIVVHKNLNLCIIHFKKYKTINKIKFTNHQL